MSKPFLPWIGGKRRLAKHILPLFPKHTCYCEPFCGAAALFLMKEPSKAEVINDINSDLITLYRVVQNHLEEFIKHFKWQLASREMYKLFQESNPDTLTDIQRAVRFYYLQKLSFGGKVNGRVFGTSATSPPRLNLLRLEEDLSAAHLRLARVTIENLDWQRCIRKYDRPHTLFYLDPPYWQTEGYGVPFTIDQYNDMAELMRSVKGRVVLSINAHPDMGNVFADFESRKVTLSYTVGGGKKRADELIIWNF